MTIFLIILFAAFNFYMGYRIGLSKAISIAKDYCTAVFSLIENRLDDNSFEALTKTKELLSKMTAEEIFQELRNIPANNSK